MTNLDQFTRAPQGSFKLQRKLLAATVAACFGVAQANPTLPQVVAGQATFAQQGNVFSITNTPNTIINWQSFSVGRDEITRFIQQSSDSKVLNRITGQDPSQILGSLQSNGQVFLINPNGVLFGKDARIDVNGLVASSLQLSNSDFLAGKHNFQGEAGAGKVVNQGSITTPQGGKVFLIAPTVENHGVISAPNGEILLAAGKSVQLVDSANPAITVVVSAPEDQALNLGQIVAQGGRVGIYGALVNQRGVVNANSAVRGENGKIILKASRSTLLEAGSQTTASGAGKGGEIQILGQNVALNGDARVDASGREGGGTVLLGGDYQGKNSAVQNARQAFIGKNAVIRADAEASGDGGRVIVWADEATRAYGAISARSAGGKGGFVETSGHYLDVAGLRVDTTGLDATGVWLLDPYNIEVVSTSYGAYGLVDVADFNGGVPSPGTTQILASTINGATSNVVLQATNDISINAAVSMTAAGKSFTAYAGNDINVNANLQTNGGAIGLYANYAPSGSASGDGAVNLAGSRTINSGAADITLSGISVNLNGSVTATPGGARVGDNAPLISLRANNLDIADTGSVNNSAGDGGYVSIAPFISTYNMSIMGADSPSAGTMVLQAADLGRVNAYELALGGASVGEVSIYAPLDLHANLVVDAKSAIQHSGSIDANGHSVFFNVYDDTGSINGNYGTFTEVDTLRLRADHFNYSGVANSIVANKVYVDKASLDADISLGGTNPAGAYLSESELKMFDAPLISIGTASGYTGAVEVSEALNLSGSNAGATRGGTTGVLALKGSTVALYGDLVANKNVQLEASDGVYQWSGHIEADRLAAAGGEINLVQSTNQIGSVALEAGNINLGANGNLLVESVVQREGSEPGHVNITLNSPATTLTVQDIDAENGIQLNAQNVTVADGGTLSGETIGIRTGSLNINGTGKIIAPQYLLLDATGAVTLGGTLASVEGGILLNNTALGKLTVGGLFVETESGNDLHLYNTSLANTTLGLSSDNTLYVHGDVAIKGGHLSARSYDLSAAGSIDAGTGYLSLTTANGDGIFNVSAAATPGITSVSGADLAKFKAGTLALDGPGGITISDVVARGAGGLTLQATEGTVNVNAAVNVDGQFSVMSPQLNITAPVVTGGSTLTLSDMNLSGSGSLASPFIHINAQDGAYLGGTLNNVEGAGLTLTADELTKLNAQSVFVSANGYGGDITLDDLTVANTYLGVSASGLLSNEGLVKAKGLSLSAGEFDLAGSGTGLTADEGLGNITFGTSRSNGILQVNGSSGTNTVISDTVLDKVSAGSVSFNGYSGVQIAGAMNRTSGNLSFLSYAGSVDFNAAVDVGTGNVTVQSAAVNLANTVHANTVTLAPLTSSNEYKSMVIGGSCSSTACVSVTNLGNVDAQRVNLGMTYNTSSIDVAGIAKGSKRHEHTLNIGLNAKNAITQSAAIDVANLYVQTEGEVTLANAANTVSNLRVDGATAIDFRNAGDLNILGGGASGTVNLEVVSGVLTSSAYLAADTLRLSAANGIGTTTAAFLSKAKVIDAATTATSGTSSINISNNESSSRQAVRVDRLLVQNGNAGSITFSNYGATTIAAGDTAGTVRSGSGAISITAHSPLRIEGKVVSQSGAITLEAGTSSVATDDVLTVVGSGVRVQSGGTVRLVGSNAVSATASQISGSTVTTVVNGVVVTPPVSPPPVDPPPANPPPVNPPPVNPPPVNPPPVDPPPVNPPPVNPPPVDPPPVNPPPVNPPPVNPPPVNPPPVNPPPTADICTIAPNSALCQVLTPPTASEPVKPVDRAVAQVINVINTAQEDTKPASTGSGSSGSTGKTSGPAKTDDKKEDAKDEKKEDKSAQSGTKEPTNEKPAAKSYCN
ncbi:beta strand repeat-containing protein [Pseudoduganella rhizocola]|uniref:beta strand repeat-containing protein n=1 Tax=Pseudoduganella rhizocola TaxID=3382643 RepID=UPI0038B4C658